MLTLITAHVVHPSIYKKTIVRNGCTLVYRIQNDKEIPLATQSESLSVSYPDATTFASITFPSAWHFSFEKIKGPCLMCGW